ncbi:MaoC/PaaZ C-terminal domain-containing protein [Sphingobium sp. Sx8-8]|uniref:MaoC/PaaZ C-terminal domain-containing protein n=1 Tax=Sphingobium sp. Sx8-8 TaxID=2933617 RepID=UPI001F59C327|nr:MaoC/PaaZ C-terminal domain-containing protein [Sphingobium sp. Sx8-8]
MADSKAAVDRLAEPRVRSVMDPESLLNLPPRIIRHSYTRRDTMLYALGVGAGRDPMGEADLPYVFEDNLRALPTMAVVLAYPGFWQMEPRYGIDWRRVLHAEQSCEFHTPLPVEGTVRGEFSVDAIVDKGAEKGALLRARRLIYDEADQRLLATVRQISFLRGDGGRGGGGTALIPLPAVPGRTPDKRIMFEVRHEQALVYRLSGDYNPLHASPAAARDAGFAKPLLHGLCTYGFAGRAVLAAACGNDPVRLKTLECRFTAPVHPGDNLDVLIWQEAAQDIAFQIIVPERQEVVIDNGKAQIASCVNA